MGLSAEAELKRAKWQEIANRGLQDKFDPETRMKFDKAVERGFVTLPTQPAPVATTEQPTAAEKTDTGWLPHVMGVFGPAGRALGSYIADDPDRAVGDARSVGQGALLGFGDEVEAGFRTGFGLLGDYKETRDEIRGEIDQYRKDNPVRAYGTEIATAIATGKVPGQLATKVPGVSGKVAQLGAQVDRLPKWMATALKTATPASLYGAVYGSGTAEELEDIPDDAALAALISGAAPIGLKVAATVFKKGWKGVTDFLPPITNAQAEERAVRAIVRAGGDPEKARAAIRLEQETDVKLDAAAVYLENRAQKALQDAAFGKVTQKTVDKVSDYLAHNTEAATQYIKGFATLIGLSPQEAIKRKGLYGQLAGIKPDAKKLKDITASPAWKKQQKSLVNNPEFLEEVRKTGVEPLKKVSQAVTKRARTITKSTATTQADTTGTTVNRATKSRSAFGAEDKVVDRGSDLTRAATRDANTKTTKISEVDELDLENFNAQSMDVLKRYIDSVRTYGDEAYAALSTKGKIAEGYLTQLSKAIRSATDAGAQNSKQAGLYEEYRTLGQRYKVAKNIHRQLFGTTKTKGDITVDLDAMWAQHFSTKEGYKALQKEVSSIQDKEVRRAALKNLYNIRKLLGGMQESSTRKVFSGGTAEEVKVRASWDIMTRLGLGDLAAGIKNDAIIDFFLHPQRYEKAITKALSGKTQAERASGFKGVLQDATRNIQNYAENHLAYDAGVGAAVAVSN